MRRTVLPLASAALAILLAVLIATAIVLDSANAQVPIKKGPRLAASCLFSHTSSDDPMFMPGMQDQGHEHTFFGNRSTDAFSTYPSLREHHATHLCKQPADGSAYWAPLLQWGGKTLKPAARSITYYNVTPRISRKKVRAFPPGAMLVARDDNGPGRAEWRCGKGAYKRYAPKSCSESTITVRVWFPQCWNRKQKPVLGSEAGAWSVIQPKDGSCPSSHPILLPQISMQMNYRIPSKQGPVRVSAGHGEWKGPGFMHANFINAWDQRRLEEFIDKCIHDVAPNERRPEVCRTAGLEAGN